MDIPTKLKQWQINQVSFLGFHEHHTIDFQNCDEGEMFERAVWASLESIFPLTLYKNAQVSIGGMTRELIDVISSYEYGSFLIEAKDFSVFQAGFLRDQERRTKGVQKQVKKAISQLIGASKAISKGELIFDANNKALHIVRDQPAHCIVLITALMHCGDWSAIEAELMKAMRSTGNFFHLLDLREFIRLLKVSSGKPQLLDYNLLGRCQAFHQERSVHIRFKI